MDDKALTHELIHLLSHSRHDWMNKLQLIKGNLTLKSMTAYLKLSMKWSSKLSMNQSFQTLESARGV